MAAAITKAPTHMNSADEEKPTNALLMFANPRKTAIGTAIKLLIGRGMGSTAYNVNNHASNAIAF